MLELKKISKTYNTNNFKQTALNNVSISFREQEFAAILGPSGSGKTTLLNIIGGLDKYDSGDLIINNVSTKLYKDRDWDTYRNYRVGFVFQNYNLISHQSILSNVELALTLGGVSKEERKAKAIEVLTKVGLKDHIYKKPNQLSGGQMQRVSIARALVNDPDIILADEPTGALDSNTSVQIMELLKEVSKTKLVIMVTHNPELAKNYATRIINIKDGKVVDDTNPYKDVKSKVIEENFTKRTSMSLLTAFSLSFNNLMTKKGRTILVSLAGSIGIIGIALIMSLSNGFQNYINSIQEDTLSSYPLSITSKQADMTSLFLSMMDKEYSDDKSNKVHEKQYITSMFGSVSKNNLKSFKDYYEKNKLLLKDDISSVKYSYNVTPNIYTLDSKNKISKLNPSSLMTSMYSSNVASTYQSFSSVFNEMIDNMDKLKSQYDVLKGRWPSKYDEMVIVLPNKNTISDLLVYSLGIRDYSELNDMVTKLMSGEKININNKPYDFTYDELMNIKLKLILPYETYKYNSKYNIYEDMSDNEEYMKNLYDKALNIKIVGIVTLKDGINSMSLNPGVAYTKELTNYLIDKSKNSDIVKKQLSNKDIDVFSNKKFDDNNKSNINFEELIKVDTNMLKNAFNIDIDENTIKNNTSNTISKISSSITTDTSKAKKDFLSILNTLLDNLLTNYIKNPLKTSKLLNNEEVAILEMNDIETIVNNFMNNENTIKILKELENNYIIPYDIFNSTYTNLLKGFLTSYITLYNQNDSSFTTDPNNMASPITNEVINQSINLYVNSSVIISTSDMMASKMTEAVMQKTILSEVSHLTNNLISTFSKAFNVDEKKIASAFKFNLTEEELKRIMTSFASNSEKTYSNNLINLGYQDIDDPTMISFYFNSFDSKENFIDFVDKYNDKVKNNGNNEDEIKYTDTTGILMSSVKKVVNTVSYVLIAFVSISLVVSSIMIAIITYISVLERTKEIGILRAVGASKKDIAHVFNAETFIEGFISGILGIGVTLILCIPINIIINNLINVKNIATLPLYGGVGLILLSVILTLIAGIIPSNMASKKDPVEALRTE